jgi:Cysteine-rich CPCC
MSAQKRKVHACPCCGYVVFRELAGSYEICPICFWEDDPVQAADPWFAGGANKPSLAEAQRNYAEFGAVERRFIRNVRRPDDSDAVDRTWRPLRESDREFSTTPKHIERLCSGWEQVPRTTIGFVTARSAV